VIRQRWKLAQIPLCALLRGKDGRTVQRLLSGLVVLGFAFTLGVSATGCKKAANNNTSSGTPPSGGGITYELSLAEITIAPGESKDVTLKRSGKDLKDQEVTATGEGKVKAEGGKFKGDAKEVKITIKAGDDAEEKDHTVKIKAGSEEKTVKVTVKKGEAAPAKAKYSVEKEEVAVAPGKKVEVKVTREGGDMKAKELKFEGIPEDAKVTVTGGEFAEKKDTATITIAADAKAPEKEYTLKFKAGGKEHTIKVKVDKKAKETGMNILPGRDLLADVRRIEAIPQFRASFPRQVALFTRQS
jgi:hypothetical protein